MDYGTANHPDADWLAVDAVDVCAEPCAAVTQCICASPEAMHSRHREMVMSATAARLTC